jgi:4-hydroxy-3-polyprenylbenzoate decarboxylase
VACGATRSTPSIVVGKPPPEDAWLGKATERIFLPAIRMSVPEIVDFDLPSQARCTTARSSRSVGASPAMPAVDHLDHAPTNQFFGGKIEIDATAKGPLEGTREWPPEIEMSAEIKALVNGRWSEDGLDTVAAGQDGQRCTLQRLLRR